MKTKIILLLALLSLTSASLAGQQCLFKVKGLTDSYTSDGYSSNSDYSTSEQYTETKEYAFHHAEIYFYLPVFTYTSSAIAVGMADASTPSDGGEYTDENYQIMHLNGNSGDVVIDVNYKVHGKKPKISGDATIDCYIDYTVVTGASMATPVSGSVKNNDLTVSIDPNN